MLTTKAFIRKYSASIETGVSTPKGHLLFLLNPANYNLSLVKPPNSGGNTDKNILLKKLEVKMNINITTDEMMAKFGIAMGLAHVNPKAVTCQGAAACEEFFKSFAVPDENPMEHQPDVASFHWGFGTEATFLGNLTYKGSFTKFNCAGMPVEGTYSITITEVKGIGEALNKLVKNFIPMASPDRSKCQVVQSGVSLWDIARAEYNDEDQWKNIAKINKISDPLDIEAGKIVKVPAIT